MIETITTTVAPGSPPTPKKKTRVIIFGLAAAGAVFIGIAAFGLYTRNQWTVEVQVRTNQATETGGSCASPKIDWNDTPSVTGSDDAVHGFADPCSDQWLSEEMVF